jgi:hypothetical protein
MTTVPANVRCPKCGYEMWVGPAKVTGGIEATLFTFCPFDHYEMQRMDALGTLEAELAGESKTFEQFVAETPNVLGVIHAEILGSDD